MKRDPLAWGALAAALVVTASAEYALARAAGFGQWTAAGVPAALDIYAVRAMRARRDVAAVVTAMILVNAAAHMVEAGLLAVSWPLVVGVSAIAPLVLWRVHRLAEQHGTAPAAPVAEAVVNTVADPVAASGEHPAVSPVFTPVPVYTEPVAEAPAIEAPAPAEPLVICGAHRVFTLTVPPVPDPPKVDARLSAEQAREVIEAGWVNGAGVRETARLATRSASYVAKVFTQLTEEKAAAAVLPGPLVLVTKEVSA
ncbi:hypothetical protein ABZ695_05775 [Streptomyces sp. NPDC006976]|uniref:hypothetical protein n=1 Tax=Streptomyces sp. NPDC006976 TaxID=3154311 RepID=UPI0033D076C8